MEEMMSSSRGSESSGRTLVRQSWTRALASFVIALGLLVTGFGGGAATVWFYKPELRQALAATAPFLLDQGEVDAAAPVEEYREEKVELLWDIWDILQREFIDPDEIERDEMIYGAASGMVGSLNDPHTVFVEPLPAQIISEDMQGSFEGIGATVNMVDGELVIVRPLPNSPALEAGLQPGDVILEADDEPLEGKNLYEAVSIIRGPEGTVVRLLIRREGVEEPFIVPVERAEVEMPIIESRMLDSGVAYVRLTEFNAVASEKLEEAIEDLLAENPLGLVLDLRGNPGGYLQEAVDVASQFLPRDTLILTEEERSDSVQEYRVKRSGQATQIPLVVLVNGSSASASEIVAGAIQDHGRGTLVGETTYGKGSVQNTHRLRDNSSLRVTIAKWYRPSGENLDGNGIVPDIEVPMTAEEMMANQDPQLDRAVEFLTTNGL